MKIKKRQEFIKKIARSLAEAQHILDNFESNNLEHSSKIAHSVVKLYEARNHSSMFIHDKQNYKKLVEYFNSVYFEHICLVLRKQETEFAYTRNNVMKFLRGAWVHTDDNKINKKLEALDEFMYEENSVKALFCISMNFVYFPCSIVYEGFNSDSVKVICETLKRADGQEIELTIIESILMGVCNEISSILRHGELGWKKPILFLEKIDTYILNKNIKQEILCQAEQWKLFRSK
jgi:hypothetical protein